MSKMIKRGKSLIRISPENSEKLEVSVNEGRSWNHLYNGGVGSFEDLMDSGKEILANTSKGLYVSTGEGRNWNRRSS